MPDDTEDVFAGLGLSLFPAAARELSLDCSCPDHAVPWKHLAATFYLLAESFDDDPLAIPAWRGREREDLLANLNAARAEGPPAADRAEQAARPLADCVDTYYAWQADVRVPSHHLGIGRTHAHTPVLILVTSHTVTVISKNQHHVLSSHRIDPDRNYWRNQTKNPDRWPGNL